MEPAAKAATLWGLIGALLFGVLSQGYQLLTGEAIGFLVVLLVMGVVGVVTGLLSYAVDARL
ncbi:hypothetical protein [Halorarius halobius]|uniref:hypothetical protein n=1 Tax=Halorarius halobius TaxID=2962671 RepID=UPI0020CDBA96|nr:hypothetical protein [Halorarius halobius]